MVWVLLEYRTHPLRYQIRESEMVTAFSRNGRKTVAIGALLILPFVIGPLFSGNNHGRASEIATSAVAASVAELESDAACAYESPLGYEQVGTTAADAHDGDLTPVRCISDPYPTFNSVAVDPEKNIVVMSD